MYNIILRLPIRKVDYKPHNRNDIGLSLDVYLKKNLSGYKNGKNVIDSISSNARLTE